MLATLLLASSLIVASGSAPGNAASADKCPSVDIMMGAYGRPPEASEKSNKNLPIPLPQVEGKTPAVLLPECRSDPPKRRKRKSDYPMA